MSSRVILGGSRYVERSSRFSATRFLRRAEHLVAGFDTAALYGRGIGEKQLGRTFGGHESVKIYTKAGVQFTPRGLRGVRWGRQRSSIIKQHMPGSFERDFPPEQVGIHVQQALVRLRRTSVHGFFLHSVPEKTDLGAYLDEMLGIKAAGIVQKIGVSIDCDPEQFDLSGFDLVQISTKYQSALRGETRLEVFVNGLFREFDRDFSRAVAAANQTPEDWKLVIGSRSIEHLYDFCAAVNLEAQ